MIKMCKTKTVTAVVLAAVLLTATLPACAAVSVSLSPLSGTPGTAVTVSGNAEPESWVSVKVLDEGGSIIFFDTMELDGSGVYSFNFVAPELPPGSLTVVAGYSSSVAQAVFTLLPEGGGSGGKDDPGSDLPRTAGARNGFLLAGLAALRAGALLNRERLAARGTGTTSRK